MGWGEQHGDSSIRRNEGRLDGNGLLFVQKGAKKDRERTSTGLERKKEDFERAGFYKMRSAILTRSVCALSNQQLIKIILKKIAHQSSACNTLGLFSIDSERD